MTKALDHLNGLKTRLQGIRIANGYATDAGKSVMLGPVPQQPGETYPFCRVHELDASVESPAPHRPTSKVSVSFLAEGFAQSDDPAQIMATAHALVGDIKQALFGDAGRDLDGTVMDAALAGWRVTPPEDGSKVVIAQVRGSYSFVDHFNAP